MRTEKLEDASNQKRELLYLNYLCIVFSLACGMVSLDASSVTYISDVMMKELGLTVAQYSMLGSSIWMTKALSSIVIGIIADKTGKRKRLLTPMLSMGGLMSLLAAFSNSYWVLLVCRFLTGCFIGATLSMMISIISRNLVKNDFGARNGFVSCGSALISGTFGPIILTAVVLKWSWRGAFGFTGVMMMLLGLLLQFSVKEVDYPIMMKKEGSSSERSVLLALFSNRIFILCLVLGIMETSAKMSLTLFGPVYLTEVCGLDSRLKGTVLSILGLLFVPASLLVPAFADKFRATRVMFFTFLLSIISPATMLFLPGSTISVVSYILFGNLAATTVSIFVYLLPSRALPLELISTANGVILGVAVFFGGFLCPVLLGSIAGTESGLKIMASICLALFAACGFLSLVLDGKNNWKLVNK